MGKMAPLVPQIGGRGDRVQGKFLEKGSCSNIDSRKDMRNMVPFVLYICGRGDSIQGKWQLQFYRFKEEETEFWENWQWRQEIGRGDRIGIVVETGKN